MDKATIQTPRLTLAPSDPVHLDPMWDAIQSSLPELHTWMAWANGTRADTGGFLQQSEEAWGKDERFTFTILLSGDAIGSIGLNRYDALLRVAELGYWVRSDLAGQGLASEAAVAIIDWGFCDLKLHRIELHAAIGNHASVRIAEKIGFQRGGILRDGTRGVDDWYDCYLYDLLESDSRLLPE